MVRLLWLSCLIVGLVMGQWQEDGLLLRRQDDTLDTLESLGIQLLSTILGPGSATSTASSATGTSSSGSASATASSTTSAAISSAVRSSSRLAASAAAETSSATPTPVASSGSDGNRHRNIAIIVGSVLGALVLILAIALLWFCCRRRRTRSERGRSPEKLMDDDDLDGLAPGGAPDMAYVTRIESWHEPRGSRNSSRGPPRGSQSRVSLVQRDTPPAERLNNGPGAPVPVPIPPPHRISQYGLIQDQNMQQEPRGPYFDHPPQRRSMDDAHRDTSRYPGYTPYRSSHSLVERQPTPLFGSGRTAGENPQHTIKRKSVGSASQAPTVVNSALNSKDPSPQHNNGTGPFIPPKSRRRESLPGSPLQHQFEFGFDDTSPQSRRTSRGMPGSWSNNSSFADTYQRY